MSLLAPSVWREGCECKLRDRHADGQYSDLLGVILQPTSESFLAEQQLRKAVAQLQLLFSRDAPRLQKARLARQMHR